MTCPVCDDKGLVRVKYHSGEPDGFGVCLCPAGAWYRSDQNAGKATGSYGWQLWAAVEGIDPERVYAVEDILHPDKLATIPQAINPPATVASIADAMRTQKPKL